ncbi:peptidyl-dipeptidase Dcp [Prolixibacter denitrificans]|uniref:Dipeptidyl carboxypeptidase n=1 Tax=Prolixibacter denitrificans TaxID=1541063 RepID=A0A2P8CCL6_9BACT|nr:peptidyl-dipeptidase Dcp [Prolixibacter denitrificans]PSK82718.1 peptidyl-dipeptidase Dcp [Prolixibacter denitrificans]GET21460.1 dipeptidyl carboxypeptidase II [Prolixibacter denitrificans]
MKRHLSFLLIALAVVITSCSNGNNGKSANSKTTDLKNNPFMKPSTLPYGAPDFTKIKDSDFQPAMEEGMKEQLAAIEKIANNPEAPTFKNTLVAMEKTGQLLNRVYGVFNLLAGANTNPTIQKIGEEEAPKLAAHHDAIYLNSKLFERVKTIYNERDTLNLDPESKKLVEYYYQQFQLAGANLSDADKAKLKKLNEEEATLSAQFTNRLMAAAKAGALVVDNKDKLAGLSDAEVQTAAQDAKADNQDGKYLIPLQNTTQQPALQSLTNRDVRHELFEHSWTRAEKGDKNDTRAIISRLAEIRADQAHLLGYKNFAAWKLQDQMAKTPEAVEKFLGKLVPAATAKAKREAAEIQKVIDKSKGGFKLKPWDWNFYAEKVRKAKYDLDENQIKPYFELNNVLENGVFYAAHELYGLTFKERHDIPVYQKDVRVFDVIDKDSTTIGLFYCDYFKRDNKSGGAWMDNIIGQSKLLGTKPVIYNVCNFTKPAPGQPALLSFDDVTTMFHEFGHALHGFFANQEYPSLSGTAVARDFVEFPSQFNEHWAMYPKVFKHYAVNYKTGKPMPQELVNKIKKSATFNQGYALTELLAAAELDMQWHTIPAGDSIKNADQFETNALQKTHLNLEQVPPRYRSTYFLHIWGNGYAAGYYAYLWTEMLDDDAYAWFEENGGLTRANGQRFRDMILSRGNTEDYEKMYKDFRGRDPEIGPMLKNRGLVAE